MTFSAPSDELAMATSHLDLKIAGADPITAAALENRVAQLAATTSVNPSFLDRVRRAAASASGAPTMAVIARALGISPRTLRRHLAQEGSTLRIVVDDVRREHAEALLAAGTPIKEIAFRLGFSEPSAFSRAYKRWTGRAPKLAAPR